MLIELHIQKFALIDDLRLEVGAGFNVLTGETGAGKSIIVDAMSAALGERTGSEVVRTGAEKSVVEAVFDVSDNPAAAKIAEEYGFEPDDGLLILSREIARGGRSQSRINGRAATASVLKDITSLMIDIHGQHEHQSLLQVPMHVDIFDAWCGPEVMTAREEAGEIYAELSRLIEERSRLQTDERERARLLDLYQFQAEEIKAANPVPEEEEELAQERNRLANAEKLYAAAAEVRSALGTDGGGIDALSTASASAEKMAHMDPSMEEFVENINSALFAAQEALAQVRDYQDQVEANPARLEQIEERIDLLRMLKRKYGDTVEDILKYGSELDGKIDDLAHAEERSHELDARIDALESRLDDSCEKLTKLRKDAAARFEKSVERELADLAMEKTRFEVSIEPAEPGPKGADKLEFLISPNPGEPVKPLAKIASGGEMSRIMLALKSVTTSAEVPTLVFDEIDTGIGGRTAQVLGEKLASISNKYQVMCVTHLPQVASKAARHFTVEKGVVEGRSVVRVTSLEGEDRVAELARMLGGKETSVTAAQHAREMLSIADQGNS
ncbi:MAG: DNA repair protein RecN [Armatimonadetes bacterium]|nr:DNA repair protein RecN [Armatimonadota bacterium]